MMSKNNSSLDTGRKIAALFCLPLDASKDALMKAFNGSDTHTSSKDQYIISSKLFDSEILKTKHFQLTRTRGMPVSTEDILADLKRVAHELHTDTLTQGQYAKYGKYSLTTATRRFGGMSKALVLAGLSVAYEGIASDQLLFENIERLWIKLGRQPTKRDLVKPLSQDSETRYNSRFGSWRKSLERFVDHVNSQEETEKEVQRSTLRDPNAHTTRREPSLRLKFLVMRRDSFKCQHCGRSPATHPNVELQIDHITAWSKGGETIFDNLKTLCSQCNLGKFDLSELPLDNSIA